MTLPPLSSLPPSSVPSFRGRFITFEGCDGSGKTTQWQQAVTWLQQRFPERTIVATRNPGGTPLGQAIRQLILTPRPSDEAPMNSMTELLLYMADRAQHVAELVRPHLEAGAIVLCDRFIDSSVAYQGVARGLPFETIAMLNKLVCGEVWPHATLLYDAPVEVLAERRALRDGHTPQDRMEKEGLTFHRQVREGFLQLARAEPERFHCLDASLPLNEVHQHTQQVLLKLIPSA
ncbi:MAG: dTMP kinase [Vampirovibrionales bacterium]